jgi:DNA polymerase-4
MNADPTILHVGMDAFYASVEQRDHPELRGKPVIVGGIKGRGVVSAASYEARKFGVHSAMPTSTARRLCPHGIYLPVRMSHYAAISRQVRSIFLSLTPLVEPLSLDEAFLDVRGCESLFGPAPEIARQIKQHIRVETGLIASVGVAPNKYLAKLASDIGKPDGYVVLLADKVTEFLAPLPFGPDLFPRSFIVSLKAPTWIPSPHRKDLNPGPLPESLRQAIRLFVVLDADTQRPFGHRHRR